MKPNRKNARLAAVLLTAIIGVACSGAASSDTTVSADGDPGQLVFASPGGSYAAGFNAAYLQVFTAETGTDVETVTGENPVPQIRAQVEAGNVQIDMVNCGPAMALANPDIWEPIDTSIVSVPDDFAYREGIGEQFAPTEVAAAPVFAYSNEVFPDDGPQPQSWADFFDTETFPGPRGVWNVGLDSAWSVPAAALLADGVTPEELFPLDLDRAYEKLDSFKDDIRVYWTSYSQSQDVLRMGEVVMNMMTDGRALQLVNTGQPYNVVFNEAFRFTAAICVPKDAPNKENAFKFIDWLYSHPEQQAVFTSLTYYGPVTEEGAAAAEDLGVAENSTAHVDDMIPDTVETVQWIADNSDELLNRWNAWVGQ